MAPADTPRDQAGGTTPEQEAAYRSVDNTLAWLSRQPGSFFRPYAGKWIAVRDCQVVAVADNHRELMSRLKAVDLPSTLIHRVERPGMVIYR